MLWKVFRFERCLIGKEPIVHFPKLALLACAACCLGGLKCVLVDCFQGEIAKDVFDLASFDIIGLDLWNRVMDEAPTKRALEVGKLYQHHLSVLLSSEGRPCDVQNDVARCGWLGSHGSC